MADKKDSEIEWDASQLSWRVPESVSYDAEAAAADDVLERAKRYQRQERRKDSDGVIRKHVVAGGDVRHSSPRQAIPKWTAAERESFGFLTRQIVGGIAQKVSAELAKRDAQIAALKSEIESLKSAKKRWFR